ncbi:MAG TPA: hypothetical protein VF183_15375 [Acidimicrobiales bacterium]
MLDPVPIPIQEAVRDFFTDLLGRGAAASKRPPLDYDEDPLVVGRYLDDDGELAALVVSDLAFAAISGAALAMIPKVVVDEAIKRGQLSDTLVENFREVVNVFSSLLNTPTTPHLVLKGLGRHPEETADLREVLTSPSRQRTFDVTIEGYGSGCLGVLVR